jgi:hypothetical protein
MRQRNTSATISGSSEKCARMADLQTRIFASELIGYCTMDCASECATEGLCQRCHTTVIGSLSVIK